MCRRFYLRREKDVSGVSGVGIVAMGVMFADMSVALHWESKFSSINIYKSIADLLLIHGHGDATKLEWLDPEPIIKKDEVKKDGN